MSQNRHGTNAHDKERRARLRRAKIKRAQERQRNRRMIAGLSAFVAVALILNAAGVGGGRTSESVQTPDQMTANAQVPETAPQTEAETEIAAETETETETEMDLVQDDADSDFDGVNGTPYLWASPAGADRGKPQDTLGEKDPSYLEGQEKIIYLTFDDGPGKYTADLLDILKKHNVKATFFVTNQFPDYQDLIGREANEGHSIGVHTCSHNYKQIYTGADAYWSDFEQEQAIIQQQTGYRSELMRFPGGSSNTVSKGAKGLMTELTQEAGEKGYTYVDWNAVSGDAERGNTKDSILAGLKNSTLQSGSNTVVMLCHDLNGNTVSVIESYLNWGQANGYHFLPMSPASSGAHHSVNN